MRSHPSNLPRPCSKIGSVSTCIGWLLIVSTSSLFAMTRNDTPHFVWQYGNMVMLPIGTSSRKRWPMGRIAHLLVSRWRFHQSNVWHDALEWRVTYCTIMCDPCGKQHFREIPTPDFVRTLRPYPIHTKWDVGFVHLLTKSGVGISRKCCFPHGYLHPWKVLRKYGFIFCSMDTFRSTFQRFVAKIRYTFKMRRSAFGNVGAAPSQIFFWRA